MIQQANAHAASTSGWSAEGHHVSHKTVDIVVSECAPLLSWLQTKLRSHITPALCAQFGLKPQEVWLEDAFIVKYTAGEGGQPGLGFHRDDSELSFNLLLSEPCGSCKGSHEGSEGEGVSKGDEGSDEGSKEAECFLGGGTAFDLDGSLTDNDEDSPRTIVSPQRGEMLSHFGRLRHAGTQSRVALATSSQVLSGRSHWQPYGINCAIQTTTRRWEREEED